MSPDSFGDPSDENPDKELGDGPSGSNRAFPRDPSLAPGFFGAKTGHFVPTSVGTVGMWLFLASLTMLFVASLIGYVLIRHLNRSKYPLPVHLPSLLWISSALVIGVSFTLSFALASVRRERQPAFRRWLSLTGVLAIGFLVVQTPSMASLYIQHRHLRAVEASASSPGSPGMALYGLIFFMVLLHALHVIGGLVALGIVTAKGMRGGYDHEHFVPVRHATMYWHFLDVVWLVMFATFLITG